MKNKASFNLVPFLDVLDAFEIGRKWLVGEMSKADREFVHKQFIASIVGMFMLAVYWQVALMDLETGLVSMDLLYWNQATAFATAATVGIGLFFYMATSMELMVDPFTPVVWLFDLLEKIGIVVEFLLIRFVLSRRKAVDPLVTTGVSPWRIVEE